MKQIAVYNELIKSMLTDTDISGIMLMGSVARGTATSTSDLDIMVLCGKDEFKTEYIGGVLVEYIFLTYENAKAKLLNHDMDLYHYLNGRIDLDKDGHLLELQETARNKYLTYKTDKILKAPLYHWLLSTKIKLASAVESGNDLLARFIIATNSWKVLEAVWAVNDKPMPPSGSVLLFMNDLISNPFDNWFSLMFCDDYYVRLDSLLKIIDWVLPRLQS